MLPTGLSPANIEFSPRRRLQPDLFVVLNTGIGEPASWQEAKKLLLVVELTSATTAYSPEQGELQPFVHGADVARREFAR
jgi:hypothetical protein